MRGAREVDLSVLPLSRPPPRALIDIMTYSSYNTSDHEDPPLSALAGLEWNHQS